MIKLLMADDDKGFTDLVSEYLAAEGQFDFRVCHDGAAAIEEVRNQEPEVLILDVGMPVLNGFEALKKIRSFSDVPVVMLTARGDDLDRILGLEIGADDYLPKPCNLRELVARVRAILRRTQKPDEAAVAGDLQVHDLQLVQGAQTAYLSGQAVSLTGAEYLVLEILLRSAGQLVDKDSIAQYALGRRIMPFDRSVDAHISHIRKKLGPHQNGLQRIKTVRGRGYLYVLP